MTRSVEVAFAVSAELRGARKRLRHALLNGEASWQEVLADPPPEIRKLALIDVARWKFNARNTAPDRLAELGRRAVCCNVNLMMPVGRASLRSRLWVADWASTVTFRGPVDRALPQPRATVSMFDVLNKEARR